MGNFSAVLSCYLGVHVGRLFLRLPAIKGRATREDARTLFRLLTPMLIEAVLWVLLGTLLHFIGNPINKNLWSPSFAIFMSGCCYGFLVLFYLAIDVLHLGWPLLPFTYMGMNSIVLYVGSEVMPPVLQMIFYGDPKKNMWEAFRRNIYMWNDEPVAGFLWSLNICCWWLIVGWILHYNGIFVKL